jgi:hypothetical protein
MSQSAFDLLQINLLSLTAPIARQTNGLAGYIEHWSFSKYTQSVPSPESGLFVPGTTSGAGFPMLFK